MTISASDVEAITGSTLGDKIKPFIADAAALLSSVEKFATLPVALQDRVTVNLAAHYLVTSRVGKASAAISRQKIEGVYDVTYVAAKGTTDDFGSTEFGKKANSMMGGCLNELGKRPVGLYSIGSC